MSGDHGGWRAQQPFELLIVASADPASLDAEQGVVVADLGDWQIPGFEFSRVGEHHGHGLAGNAHRLPSRRLPADKFGFAAAQQCADPFAEVLGFHRARLNVRPVFGSLCGAPVDPSLRIDTLARLPVHST